MQQYCACAVAFSSIVVVVVVVVMVVLSAVAVADNSKEGSPPVESWHSSSLHTSVGTQWDE